MPESRVRTRRLALGMSQQALAAAAQLSRQSVHAIESGRTSPAVDVALRLARTLECRVEDLFGDESPLAALSTEPAPTSATAGDRVAVVHLRGRWVSVALDGDDLPACADAIAIRRHRARVDVEPMRSPAELRDNVMTMGCAAGLGVLADRLNARSGAGRFRWLCRSSTEALEALASGRTHVAGVHLVDPKTGEANVADVRRLAGNRPLVLVTLARWQAGFVTAPGNPKRVHTAADLARRGLRVVVREPGSGARRLLDAELARAGLSFDRLSPARLVARGHVEVARTVAMGAADTGIATRDAALAFGLSFVPLADERYDLALARDSLDDPRITRLLDTMTSSAFRRELSTLGYDATPCGDRVADVLPA